MEFNILKHFANVQIRSNREAFEELKEKSKDYPELRIVIENLEKASEAELVKAEELANLDNIQDARKFIDPVTSITCTLKSLLGVYDNMVGGHPTEHELYWDKLYGRTSRA